MRPCVRLELRGEVAHVDLAVGAGCDHDHAQPGKDRRRGVRAVGRRRDEAHVALAFALRAVVRVDREQAGVLAAELQRLAARTPRRNP